MRGQMNLWTSGVLGKESRLGTRRRGCGQALVLLALLIPAPSAPFATCPMLRIHQRGGGGIENDMDVGPKLAERRPAGGGEGNVERGLREVCAPHPVSPDGDGTGHQAKAFATARPFDCAGGRCVPYGCDASVRRTKRCC